MPPTTTVCVCACVRTGVGRSCMAYTNTVCVWVERGVQGGEGDLHGAHNVLFEAAEHQRLQQRVRRYQQALVRQLHTRTHARTHTHSRAAT
jgi:hypothetical protein